jgi:hypothetical protein
MAFLPNTKIQVTNLGETIIKASVWIQAPEQQGYKKDTEGGRKGKNKFEISGSIGYLDAISICL